MNAASLFNDHTFHILLDDLFKARKSPELGPIRLQAVLDYAGKLGAPGLGPRLENNPRPNGPLVPVANMFPERPAIRQSHAPGFLVEGEEEDTAPAPAAVVGYVDQQRALRKSPDAALAETADLVQKAMEAGPWDATGTMQVRVPKTMLTSGLEAFLKRERRVQFTALNVSLALRNPQISSKVGNMSREQAENVSGGQGQRVGDWVVTITK